MPECFLGCTCKEYPCEPPAVPPRTTSSRRRENPPSGLFATTSNTILQAFASKRTAGEVTGLISAGRDSDGHSGRRRCFRSRPHYVAIRCFCKATLRWGRSLDERLCLAENTALCLACAACGGRAIRQPLHDRGRLGDHRWRCCPRTRHAIASQKMNSSDNGSLPA